MSHEINILLNQILNKDAKDVENAEKEIVEKNNAMSHLNVDIADLESKSKETRAQMTDVQIKLRDTQQRVITLVTSMKYLSFISLLQRVTL
jgi:chromosome segregation ATPase